MAVATLSAIALENVRRVASLERETERLKLDAPEPKLVGNSPPILALSETIRRVSRAQTTVLLTGETGTGKEVAARTIHDSPRATRPFVAVNCAALPEALLESELFGHERGAFTGAARRRQGASSSPTAAPSSSTRSASCRRPLQAKLLRVLQEREFERVGGTRTLKVDVRVVAATNRDLGAEVKAGRFRETSTTASASCTIDLPPLRERRDDIPRSPSIPATGCRGKGGRRQRITPEAMASLRAYDWPGNVRELENAIERAVVLGSTDEILPDDLTEAHRRSACPRGERRGGEHPVRDHRGQEEGGRGRVQGQRRELHGHGAHAGCSPELSAPPDQEPRHQGRLLNGGE